MNETKSITQVFGENLERVRKSKKLSRPALAALTNIPATTITAIERGVREPNLERLVVLAKVLDVPVNELLGDEQQVRRAARLAQIAHCKVDAELDRQIQITVPFKLQRDADGEITIDPVAGSGTITVDAGDFVKFIDAVIIEALHADETFRTTIFRILREFLPPADVDRLPTK